jgi:RNA polymerase sigma-70 factor (ECF subfamily)
MTDHDHRETYSLVERARAGDSGAFGELYDQYAAAVYRFVMFRIGNAHDAEDLMQLVFLKMIEALPRYESRGLPFGAWVFRIARNAVIDHIRTRRSHDPIERVGDPVMRSVDGRDPASTVPDQIELDAALRALTADQRDVIAYRFFAGLSPVEIASVMRKREGSVRALQFRALGAMRRRLVDSPAAGPLLDGNLSR